MEQPLKFRLHIVSPVHIGCDDVYEPTCFHLDESRKKIVVFDEIAFIKSLSPDELNRFSQICMEGTILSIPKIYGFIGGKKPAGREIDIASGLIENYRRVKEFQRTKDERRVRQELNNFTMSRTAYTPHFDMPLVPGSSLKGSLRTAYLNKCAEGGRVRQERGKANQLEKELLGGAFDTDPFRLVKVSDFSPVGQIRTKIVYGVNKKKVPSKFEARGPYQVMEVIEPGSVFKGTIAIDRPLPKTGIKNPVDQTALFKSVQQFYGGLFQVEAALIKGIKANTDLYTKVLERFQSGFGSQYFMVRIGRHSGAEAVTIDGYRQIRIMKGRGKPPDFKSSATTLWLASDTPKTSHNTGLLPFGWAVLEMVDQFDQDAPAVLNDGLQPALAKTAVPQPPAEPPQPRVEEKPIERFITRMEALKPNEAGPIATLIDEALAELSDEAEKRQFALAVKTRMGGLFKKSKAKQRLAGLIG